MSFHYLDLPKCLLPMMSLNQNIAGIHSPLPLPIHISYRLWIRCLWRHRTEVTLELLFLVKLKVVNLPTGIQLIVSPRLVIIQRGIIIVCGEVGFLLWWFFAFSDVVWSLLTAVPGDKICCLWSLNPFCHLINCNILAHSEYQQSSWVLRGTRYRGHVTEQESQLPFR